jgi:hypothetical protein
MGKSNADKVRTATVTSEEFLSGLPAGTRVRVISDALHHSYGWGDFHLVTTDTSREFVDFTSFPDEDDERTDWVHGRTAWVAPERLAFDEED